MAKTKISPALFGFGAGAAVAFLWIAWKIRGGGLSADLAPAPAQATVPEGDILTWSWNVENSRMVGSSIVQWEIFIDPPAVDPLPFPDLVGPSITIPPLSFISLISEEWTAVGVGDHEILHLLRPMEGGSPTGEDPLFGTTFVTVVQGSEAVMSMVGEPSIN